MAAKARGGNPMGQPPPFCRCGASDHPERAHGLGDADEAGDVGAQDIVAGGAIFVGGRGELSWMLRMICASRCSVWSKVQLSREAFCCISSAEVATPPALAALPGANITPF